MDDVDEPFEQAAGRGCAGGEGGGGEAEVRHEIVERGLVGVEMVVVVEGAAAEGKDREMHQREKKHDDPRIVLQEIGEVLPG